MTKNTIGKFMVVLRKANGMTQQEVADRLNVSNKAVSRWERDECAPDISLIPAIAEMYGITCDELLKGERIPDSNSTNKYIKVEKQIKILISRTLTNFKTYIYISLAISIIGLVLMFGISYGFYRPIIGFSVMLLLEIISFVITLLAVNKTKDIKNNELFETIDNKSIENFNHTLYESSYNNYFIIISVVLLSLPLVLFTTEYINAVLSIYSYITLFFGGILIILLFVYAKFKRIYIHWMNENKLPPKSNTIVDQNKRKLNFIQIGLVILASLIFIYSPYLNFKPHENFSIVECFVIIGLISLFANILYFIIFITKNKSIFRNYLLTGIRNILFIPSAIIISNMHDIGWDIASNRYDLWSTEYLWYAIVYTTLIYMLFYFIEYIVNKKINTIVNGVD